jgi:hypothetical protein
MIRNRLPNFTAKASLLNSRDSGDGIMSNRVRYTTRSYNTQTMSEKITPQITQAQCNAMPCEECHESRRCYKECYTWRSAQQECASYFKKCSDPLPKRKWDCSCSEPRYTTESSCIANWGTWCCENPCTGLGVCTVS